MNEIMLNDTQLQEEADKKHNLIINISTEIKRNLLDLAIVLKYMHDKKLYKFYNDTWEAYLANPEIAISRFFAFKIIRNYEIWTEEYHVSQAKLKIDAEKLYDIGKMITGKNLTPEEVEEKLEQARNLSRSDVRQLKGREYQSNYKVVTCPKCGHEFKVGM